MHTRALLIGGFVAALALNPNQAQADSIIFHDEASFLAAAGALNMESFENLLLGAVSSSFALSTFTLTADQSLQVLDASNSPYAGVGGGQAVINYNFTSQTELSTSYRFDLANPTFAFGLWVFDWGTLGPGGSNWTWTTNSNEHPGVLATRPNEPCDSTGHPNDCWQFMGFINTDSSFTQVLMTDPDGFGDGYMFDRVYSAASPVAVPEPTSLLLLSLAGGALLANNRRRL